ncbi:hypothetical protein ACHAXR_007829 [Thalassiosira sp. AJA248-18]
MSSQTAICYCGIQQPHNASAPADIISQQQLLCQPCATRRLASQISRYRSATDTHEQKREECRRRLLGTRLPPPNNSDNSSSEPLSPPLRSGQPLPDPSQINQQVSQLKQRLGMLRSQSNSAAVRVTAKTMENDEREQNLHSDSAKVQLARERLDRMGQCLLMQSEANINYFKLGVGSNDKKSQDGGLHQSQVGGGLKDALVSGTQQIQTMRFHFACKVFDMHRLDVGEQYSTLSVPKDRNNHLTKGNESATGVGKIGGLPLPHAGPALYGVIPPVVLASSLRLVASLTQLVARCLGVVLPHPILVCCRECQCGAMYDFGGDVIDVSNDDECDEDEEYLDNSEHNLHLCSACRHEGLSENGTMKRPQQNSLSPSSSSSSAQSQRKSSLLSFVGSSARKAIAITSSATSRAITHMQQSSNSIDSVSSGITPQKISAHGVHSTNPASNEVSMSIRLIERRITHASFAYLRENHDKSAAEYVLNPPRWREEGNPMSKNDASMDSNCDPNKNQTDLNNRMQAQTFANREEFHVAEERFATGMQLLQNDVVALCFRAGVDVSTLWPAESVLLNLHSLLCHCKNMAEASSQ